MASGDEGIDPRRVVRELPHEFAHFGATTSKGVPNMSFIQKPFTAENPAIEVRTILDSAA
ncbi:MAG TPA: hypothetical protein VD771_09285 [Gemmatimonadaceae bacterium]|nr:hypothetical protein [Gemmatimonadaceae bacterium]